MLVPRCEEGIGPYQPEQIYGKRLVIEDEVLAGTRVLVLG